MNIEIQQRGKNVVILISMKCGYAGTRAIEIMCDVQNSAYAGLMAESLSDQFKEQLREIRRNAYEEGWKNHRQHKPKAKWFTSLLHYTRPW